MKEKFVPQFLDPKSGELKPIPPERLAEIKKEEKELEEKEKSRTIRLKRDATFADLFNAVEDIEDSEAYEEYWEIFDEELINNFEPDVAEGILSLRSDQASKAKSTNILDYFKGHGYTQKEISAFLPIKFKKERK